VSLIFRVISAIIMFCVKCGAENPDGAEFCHNCGRKIYSPTRVTTEVRAEEPTPEKGVGFTPLIGPPPSVPPVRSGYEWAMVYGWALILAGLYLVSAGLLSVLTDQAVTPSATQFGNFKPMGIASSLVQGLLFVAAGLAIVRREKVAVVLVWINIGVSGLGVLLRGLIPMDLFVWMAGLGLAIWYTTKTLPSEKPQPRERSQPFAGRTNSWLEANGFGLVVVLVLALLAVVFSLVEWSDRGLTSLPTTGATASQVRRQNDRRPLTSEELKEIQQDLLPTLTPSAVISRCGTPLNDKIKPCDGCKYKESRERDISYKGANDSTVILKFMNFFGRSWDFSSMSDGGTEYYVLEKDGKSHILAALPCVGERIP
jgi:hypothetical protein